MKEVRFLELYLYKSGSKLADKNGKRWQRNASRSSWNDIYWRWPSISDSTVAACLFTILISFFFRAKRFVLDPIYHRQEPDLSCSSNRSHPTVVLNLKFPSWVRWDSANTKIKREKTGESPQLSESLEQAKLGQVRKWVWILEIWSENGCGKWHILVWNKLRIRRTGRHTPTKNS